MGSGDVGVSARAVRGRHERPQAQREERGDGKQRGAGKRKRRERRRRHSAGCEGTEPTAITPSPSPPTPHAEGARPHLDVERAEVWREVEQLLVLGRLRELSLAACPSAPPDARGSARGTARKRRRARGLARRRFGGKRAVQAAAGRERQPGVRSPDPLASAAIAAVTAIAAIAAAVAAVASAAVAAAVANRVAVGNNAVPLHMHAPVRAGEHARAPRARGRGEKPRAHRTSPVFARAGPAAAVAAARQSGDDRRTARVRQRHQAPAAARALSAARAHVRPPKASRLARRRDAAAAACSCRLVVVRTEALEQQRHLEGGALVRARAPQRQPRVGVQAQDLARDGEAEAGASRAAQRANVRLRPPKVVVVVERGELVRLEAQARVSDRDAERAHAAVCADLSAHWAHLIAAAAAAAHLLPRDQSYLAARIRELECVGHTVVQALLQPAHVADQQGARQLVRHGLGDQAHPLRLRDARIRGDGGV